MNLTSSAASFAQAGVASALEHAADDMKRMIAGCRVRRDVLEPEGAFYVFPRVEKLASRLNMTTPELAGWLLEEAGVATVPGDAFQAPGKFLRMAYCRPIGEIHEAVARIEAAVTNGRC
jgi:aspartate/methionine/tyrosine aminotransferase